MTDSFSDKLRSIESKWQNEWSDRKVFQADPEEDRDNFYVTVAYPYPSGGMHIGHVRTYMLPDVFARFKRMKGKNVLFPMGWHVTGTPINGALDRLKRGEEKQWDVLTNTYNVPESDLNSFEEPMDFANYFIENSYKPNMKDLGFGVDWRREFTTNDDRYNKFIEWQYKRLRDKGLVKKGMHPTKYCINEENPVTTHDLLEGEDAERQEYSLVKFEQNGKIFPMATLRPETVYGVTHTLINPEADYVEAEVDGEKWVISKEAAEKLEYQDREVEITGEKKGREFVGQEVENPVTGKEVKILPATFVDPDSGSGIVMSVPAHAPYDWISLKDIQRDEETLRQHGLDVEEVQSIEPIEIIEVDGYEDYPAKQVCEEHGIETQEDEEALEDATEEVYEKEFHTGRLNGKCGEFEGRKVEEVKEELKQKFEEENSFDSMYDFSEEVVCRCGSDVVVSMQESWFLEYGNEEWKQKVKKCLDEMELIPEDSKQEYIDAVDWLESWPCIRNFGLGTQLPFDEDFIVEPLSDSTIYMAFYTISHIAQKVEPEKLQPEFFDYVYQDKGTAEEVAEETGIDIEIVKEAKESFEYWYPMNRRTTAYPHIQNHLTFMLFHHTALFDEEYWPQGIATWGLVTLEGRKMSSSKGHVELPDRVVEKYGADTVRFYLFGKLEPWEDFDWTDEGVQDYQKKIENFYNRTQEFYNEGEERQENRLDRYTVSRLQKIIEDTTESLENFQTRKASITAFYELNKVINKYRNRAETVNKSVMNQLVETQIKLLVPFIPHTCEELWEEIGKEEILATSEWPESDQSRRDREIEQEEQFFEQTVEDIRAVAEIVEDFNKIKIVVAEDWKRDLFKEMKELIEERPDFGEAMGRLVEGRKDKADTIKGYLQEYLDEPGEFPTEIFTADEETEIIREHSDYLQNEFNAEIEIDQENESEEKKASRSEPGKPAIIME